MLDEHFTHKFPEWQLDQALFETTGDSPSAFWKKSIVQPTDDPDARVALSSWFPTDRPLLLRHQVTLPLYPRTVRSDSASMKRGTRRRIGVSALISQLRQTTSPV
jgi:hypothetical protein